MRVQAFTFDPYTEPPQALKEEQVGWLSEPWDQHLPARKGFITDFVFGSRGFEAPTIFCTWAAIWAVSAITRRGAWLSHYPEKFYPNVYIILVAPPAICKKGTITRFASTVVRQIGHFIANDTLRQIKHVRMVMNKIVPEALIKRLKPLEIHVDGEEEALDLGSQLVIVAPELSVFLGKQAYNTGLIELMIDLYDCPDYWEYTKSGGEDKEKALVIPIRKGFISLLGASTPDGLSMSVPEAAFGDGFMSRAITVYQEHSTRKFPDPFHPAGAPTDYELARRLSWIATHQVGEYHMSKEAHQYWVEWYDEFCKFRNREISDKDPRSRFDVVLRKLALLFRIQRYEEGEEIRLEDVKEAQAILDATFVRSEQATKDVGLSQFMKNVRTAEKRVRTHGSRTRRELLTGIRGWRDAYECTRALQHLHDEGKVRIWRGDREVHKTSNKSDEYYDWSGGMEERFGD